MGKHSLNNETKNQETITMPNGIVKTYQECIDNILYVRDMDVYLDTLIALKNRYLIVLSTRYIVGHHITESVLKKMHQLGFSELTKWEGRTYVGVIDKGHVERNQTSQKAYLTTECSYENEIISLSVKSEGHSWGKSEIILNNKNYSMNCGGWNIVIFDYNNKQVIDVSTYGSYDGKPTFYHGHLGFDQNYIDSHFFIPEKYIDLWRISSQKSYFSNENLQIRELENGIILPNKIIGNTVCGGLCDEKFNLFSGHLTYQREVGERVRYISESYTVEEDEIEYVNETVVYGGPMMNHLGHLIVELGLTRTWWCLENLNKNPKIAITIHAAATTKAVNFIKEFFEISGISENQLIFVSKPMKFKKVIVPDQCIVPSHVQVPYIFTKELVQGFNQIRSNIKPGKYKKIYFAKLKTARKNIIGEDYFIDFYKKKGYKIIFPEEHTLAEKASLLAGADEFATMIGTNAHFAIFCKTTTIITLLTRTNSTPHAAQSLVNELINNKNIYFVNVSLGFFHKYDWDGLSFMGVTKEFIKYVKEVFNEDLDITPEEYLRRNLYDYFSYIPKYYSNPSNFNYLKNQKMITILQNISELFLDEDFDTSKLDLTTNEDNLRSQVKKLTSDLSVSKNRVSELENTDVGKISMAINDAIGRLKKEISELEKSLSDLQ